jgi:MHS family proline/betaine transporter-like MFS transporter
LAGRSGRDGRCGWPGFWPSPAVGRYLRLRLDETPRFRAIQRVRDVAQWPVGEALRADPGRMPTGFVLVAAASLTFNTLFILLPNQLVADLGLDPTPLLAVVSELLRLYADALRLPNPTGL